MRQKDGKINLAAYDKEYNPTSARLQSSILPDLSQQQPRPSSREPSRTESGVTGDVSGFFSHHVRRGAARHPEASPGPRGGCHAGERHEYFRSSSSLSVAKAAGSCWLAGWLLAGVFPGTGSLSAGTEVVAGRDSFRCFFLSIAQSFR